MDHLKYHLADSKLADMHKEAQQAHLAEKFEAAKQTAHPSFFARVLNAVIALARVRTPAPRHVPPAPYTLATDEFPVV